MESGWQEGRRHTVECNLKSFFDTVNHDRLMNALREKCRCRRTLGLIRRYLMAGVVLPDGTREATPQGVPQGGPPSPLLEAMEATAHAPPSSAGFGCRSRNRAHGDAEPQRVLADEPE